MPSTVISSIEYDPEQEVLTIVFRSGKIYYYKNVPQKVYIELRSSRSKGRFLNQSIKGNYQYETFDG